MITAITFTEMKPDSQIVHIAKATRMNRIATFWKRAKFATFLLASISGLFTSSSPSTVRWFVISVIVNPVKGMNLRRFWSHIGQEISERSFPSLAYSYSSSMVSGMLRIIEMTARHHIVPSSVFRGWRNSSMQMTMLYEHIYIVPQKVT